MAAWKRDFILAGLKCVFCLQCFILLWFLLNRHPAYFQLLGAFIYLFIFFYIWWPTYELKSNLKPVSVLSLVLTCAALISPRKYVQFWHQTRRGLPWASTGISRLSEHCSMWNDLFFPSLSFTLFNTPFFGWGHGKCPHAVMFSTLCAAQLKTYNTYEYLLYKYRRSFKVSR